MFSDLLVTLTFTFVSVLLTQSVLLQSAAITGTAVTGPLSSLTIVQSDLKMCSPVLART